MSNYTKTTNFAAKDSLPSGNAAKIVKGAEIDTEFNNIATASATKANANNAALTGTTVFETLSDGTIGVTGWVDEDNMSSNSAVLIPTQQSVKAYVDSQVTAQDLDVTDGSNSIDIDLDSESLGILGGTGIDSTASGTGVTLAIDSTVTTLTGAQTLTNKTLTTPTILTSFTIGSATITEAELEILDGATVTTAELNVLDGITSTTAELNILDGVTSTASELNILDGVTSTATELNILDGVTATTAEINYVDGVTSNVQTQINTKAPIDGATFTGTTTIPTADINGGAIDGTVIGGSTAAAVSATTVSASGNITVGGTVDGRDVATDGTKLDGIEASADVTDTANVTAAGALMDSELTAIASVKALNQGVATSDSPTFTNLTLSGTGSVKVPAGTTAQRDGSPAAGMFRYNSSLEQFEGYTSEWGSIGGGGGTNTFTTDSFTGNGSTTAYALSQVTSSEDNLLVFIEGVFQQQDAYSIATASGTTTLTFSAAPANGNAILIYSVAAGISGSNLNIDSMTGDGSDTTLTLSIAPVNENNTQVFIDGVYQSKSNYSISGTTLTFSTAPPTGTAVEVMTFTQTDINVPVDGTITPAKIASGDFYFDTDTLYVDATNDRVGIGTSSPAKELEIKAASVPTLKLNQAGTYGAEIALRGNDLDIAGSANDIVFYTGGNNDVSTTERMRIDSAGSVGIGTSSPATQLFVKSASNAANVFAIESANAAQRLQFGVNTSNGGSYIFEQKAQALRFGTSDTERMRIDSSGRVMVALTTHATDANLSSAGASGRFAAAFNNAATSAGYGVGVASATGEAMYFYHGGTFASLVGRVRTNSTTCFFENLSDQRLKENIEDADDAGSRIDAIQVRKFDWKVDGSHQDYGMIAQELQAVAPEAVSPTLNPEDMMGVDFSKLVPMLVKEIQSLRTRVQTLENN